MAGRPPKPDPNAPARIWVDADSCSSSTMQTLLRFANELRVSLTLVASSAQDWPYTPFVRSVVLQPGFGVSGRIAGVVAAGDVVITMDKELVATTGQKRATALSPREGPEQLAGLLAQSLRKKVAALKEGA